MASRTVLLRRGSTQTKIKNQFYGNVRLLLKTITRCCLKASSGFINDIRTDALLHIYDGTGSTHVLRQTSRDKLWSRRLWNGSGSRSTGGSASPLSLRTRRTTKDWPTNW